MAPHALIDVQLTLPVLRQLSGELAGHTFVKVVYDRGRQALHALDHSRCEFHVNYVGAQLGLTPEEIDTGLDTLNHDLYTAPERRFFAGVLAVHERTDPPVGEEPFFCSLETTQVDTMTADMLIEFYDAVRSRLGSTLPLVVKPAHHKQEASVADVPADVLPRVSAHELFSTAPFVPLNPGLAEGRLRVFADEDAYRRAVESLEWFDVLAMPRVPDDVPRISGLINAEHTTPLSHTNVLAAGWGIPNAIQIGVLKQIDADRLDGEWVRYRVDPEASKIALEPIPAPEQAPERPSWTTTKVAVDAPITAPTAPVPLHRLRAASRDTYGTKAANLGELHHVLATGSPKLAGFYEIRRPPRQDLLGYLPALLGVDNLDGAPAEAAGEFLRRHVRLPRGVAVPFSLQQSFLASSPAIQQMIGKLKMALELGAREVDALCLSLQTLIRSTPFPEAVLTEIDAAIARHLAGVSTFVIRSSSNAEDLAGFSAAGIYESVNHVSTIDQLLDSIREVWASLVSPRSVRLRQQAGISLDDAYMGVIVQEQAPAQLGGVLVTTNPLSRDDFRNVFVNAAPSAAADVVDGRGAPLQYLFNTVEGGGSTISIGDSNSDLPDSQLTALGRLAVAGRLLQAHFSPDYTYAAPVDVEWVLNDDVITLLQLRPYAG
ncbi:MAG: PEP/pyruvate-binding domain-containing protein [Stackebrandtia sp.]